MPAIGYGTCCRPSAKGEPLIVSTKEFLAQGGRLIDTAQMYLNEAEIGLAIRDSGVPRSSIWITDKINTGPWVGDGPINTRAGTVASVRASLKAIDTDYIDLMHIHGTWSIDRAEQLEVWKGLIEARELGLVRRIGGRNRPRVCPNRECASTLQDPPGS
jgi:diketogulonate reductase-like aldo/keto reductase